MNGNEQAGIPPYSIRYQLAKSLPFAKIAYKKGGSRPITLATTFYYYYI
jgi:hypothetical protein